MCGIVGAASSWLTPAERDIFKDLLVVSNLRGWQGAGAITARNNCDSVEVFKTVGSGLDLAHSKDFNQDIYHRKDNRAPAVLIGHTRWPTKGAVALETTHPHVHSGVYGVHNGTIDSIDGNYIGKDDSDSAMLYKAIGERGVEAVIPEVRGAYALVWIDDELKTLNFLRNDKRPLHFAMCDNGTIFWASEVGMLRFVLGRTNTKFQELTLPVDSWHQLDMPLSHHHKQNKVTVTPLKGKAPEVAATAPFLGGYGTYGRHSSGGTGISKAATTSPPPATSSTALQQQQQKLLAPAHPAYLRTFWDEEHQATLKETSYENRVPLEWDVNLSRWFKRRPVQSATVISLSGGKDKPRKTWDYVAKDWVDIERPAIPVTTTKDTKTSGPEPLTDSTQIQTSEVGEVSTESFLSPSVDLDDDEAVQLIADEISASSGALTVEQLFDHEAYENDEGAFVETKENCWVSPFQFSKYFQDGCCWCGDTPDSERGILWVAADEYMCQTCRDTDEYARQYCQPLYGVEITTVEQELDRKLKNALAA